MNIVPEKRDSGGGNVLSVAVGRRSLLRLSGAALRYGIECTESVDTSGHTEGIPRQS